MYCRWPRSTCPLIHWPIYRSTVKVLVDRLSVDRRPIFDRYLTDTSLAVNCYISADASAVSRSIYRSTIGRLSVDYRSTIGRLSVDYRLIVDRYIGRLSADISTEATYSTHDPGRLAGSSCKCGVNVSI